MSDIFYTNVTRLFNDIAVRGIKNGKPFSRKVKYEPTLYVKSEKPSGLVTLEGEHVAPVQPGTMKDCRLFIDKYDGIENFKVYGQTNYVKQFTNAAFPGIIEFDRSKINVTSIDIEVQSDEGFPDPAYAAYPITAITIHNNIDDIYYVWGCGEWESDKRDPSLEGVHIRYTQCADEADLLHRFVDQWKKAYPDIITGWNSELFDMQYIANRLPRVTNIEARELSPFKMFDWQKRFIAGKEVNFPYFFGISCLDYLELFRKFGYAYGSQESYRLDHIAHVVLGERKLDYSEYGDLNSLYKFDYQKFIDYNIKDTQLVDRMEDKLGLITLACTIAYKGKVNYKDAFGTVGVWDAILHNYMMDQGIVVNPTGKGDKEGKIEGAHVKDPHTGMHDWVVSFDLNSLYPHIMMQYNMSPETLVPVTVPNVSVDKLLKQERFDFDKQYCMTARGNLFRKDKKGMIPTLVEGLYSERKGYKKEMLAAQQELVDMGQESDYINMVIDRMKTLESNESVGQTRGNTSFVNDAKAEYVRAKYDVEKKIATLDNKQQAIKILMNSLYGATSNEHFRYFDVRIAESITLSGQLTIRWAENRINKYLNEILKTNEDYVIAIDTDSLYVNMGPLVEKVKPKDPVVFLDKVSKEKIQPLFETAYDELKEYMNAPEQKMVMEREVIAERGVWTGKKHYALNVWNSEGVQYPEPKLKVQGIEVVRSSTPQVCRDLLKSTINEILTTDESTVQATIARVREEFNQLPAEDIAFPRTANNIDKYSEGNVIYKKGTPIHIRGSLLHNYHLERMNLTKKYEPVYPGEKIKFVYVRQPNPLAENVIAFKGILPDEFNVRKYIDYDLQFSKAFVEPIKNILDSIGWKPEKIATLEDFWS
jgi:DNA polymerase elongation subunit (family B)